MIFDIEDFKFEVHRYLQLADALYGLNDLISKQCINQSISIGFYTSISGGDAAWASHFYEGDKIKKIALRFNDHYIKKDYNYMVNVIIPHEVAHILCYLMYPKIDKGHDSDWSSICRNLGGNGEQCHSMR